MKTESKVSMTNPSSKKSALVQLTNFDGKKTEMQLPPSATLIVTLVMESDDEALQSES